MVDVTLVIFGLVALLAIALGVTMYRVIPCWLRGETVRPETDTAEET